MPPQDLADLVHRRACDLPDCDGDGAGGVPVTVVAPARAAVHRPMEIR